MMAVMACAARRTRNSAVMITASGGFDCRKECTDFMHEHFPEQYRIANFRLQKRNKFKEATPALAGLPSCMGKPWGVVLTHQFVPYWKKDLIHISLFIALLLYFFNAI